MMPNLKKKKKTQLGEMDNFSFRILKKELTFFIADILMRITMSVGSHTTILLPV